MVYLPSFLLSGKPGLVHFPCAVKAQVAGVISVDGRLPRFDAELEQIVADVEAQELIPILERFAFDVAAVLTRDLSQMLHTPGANLLHDNDGSLGGE